MFLSIGYTHEESDPGRHLRDNIEEIEEEPEYNGEQCGTGYKATPSSSSVSHIYRRTNQTYQTACLQSENTLYNN